MHREARMTGLDHPAHDLGQRRIDWQRHDLRARQHDIDDGEIGHFNGTFHHRQGVVRKQAVDLRAAQFFEQFVDVAGFAGNQLADAFQPGAGRLGTRVILVHCVRNKAHADGTVV